MRSSFCPYFVAALAVSACSSSSGVPPATEDCATPDAFLAVGDSASSGVGAITVDGSVAIAFGTDLGTDPVVVASGGSAFYVARTEGRVFALDACGRPAHSVLVNDSSHAGTSNPQSVALAPDGTLWVPRYNVPSVVVARDGALAASIDVSGAGGGGNPYASGIRIIDAGSGPKAFVPLEKLEWISGRLSPTRPSSMLRIDARTLVVEAEVPLVGRNPLNAPGAFAQSEGTFFLAEPGDFLRADEDDAGIERFEPATSSARLLVREADLGGNAVEIAVSERCGAVLLADSSADNRVSLAMVDAESGAVLARDLAGPSASFDAGLRGIAWVRSGRVLLAGDRTRTERGYPIHAFSRDDACRLTKLDDRIFVSQPPLSLAGATD